MVADVKELKILDAEIQAQTLNAKGTSHAKKRRPIRIPCRIWISPVGRKRDQVFRTAGAVSLNTATVEGALAERGTTAI